MKRNIKNTPKFAVLGAGNSGQTLTAVIASKGFSVKLWNRSSKTVDILNEKGSFEITGLINGFFKAELITTDIEKAIENTDVILVATPSLAHRNVAKTVAPYLTENQTIVLNPGSTGGALEFRNILDQHNVSKKIAIAEAENFIYICRAVETGKVFLKAIKEKCYFSTLPATELDRVTELLHHLHSQFTATSNVLTTSLNYINGMVHPVPLLFNTARAENPNVEYLHYTEGISPSIAAYIERLDAERMALGQKLELEVNSLLDWWRTNYNEPTATSLMDFLQKTHVYDEITAPNTIKHRYIFEDVPFSLVPLSNIGKLLNVPTPCTDAFINLVCVFFDVDFWKEGRTIESLGLSGMTVEEIKKYAETGIK